MDDKLDNEVLELISKIFEVDRHENIYGRNLAYGGRIANYALQNKLSSQVSFRIIKIIEEKKIQENIFDPDHRYGRPVMHLLIVIYDLAGPEHLPKLNEMLFWPEIVEDKTIYDFIERLISKIKNNE